MNLDKWADTTEPALAQRLKSRLGMREVRLRGLGIEPAQAGFAPFQPRFQPLVSAARPIPD